MNNKDIATVLKAHGIPYFFKDGRIYADTMEAGKKEFEEVIDLTGYTKKALFAWLGY